MSEVQQNKSAESQIENSDKVTEKAEKNVAGKIQADCKLDDSAAFVNSQLKESFAEASKRTLTAQEAAAAAARGQRVVGTATKQQGGRLELVDGDQKLVQGLSHEQVEKLERLQKLSADEALVDQRNQNSENALQNSEKAFPNSQSSEIAAQAQKDTLVGKAQQDARLLPVPAQCERTSNLTPDGCVVQNDYDKTANYLAQRQTLMPDGRLIIKEYVPDSKLVPSSMCIYDTDGSTTRLALNEDPFLRGAMAGGRVDANNRTVENVLLQGDLLYYYPLDNPNATPRIEKVFANQDETVIIPGQANLDRGEFFSEHQANEHISRFAPGRVDIKYPNGDLEWKGKDGQLWYQKSDGTAGVYHTDGTFVQLNRDNSIDFKEKPGGPLIRGEKLTPAESSFLMQHPGVDRRDVAEAHFIFRDQPGKIDEFYQNLSKFDVSRVLDPQQISDMQASLMHIVASPAEIYQGDMGSCNVTQIQRELAMEQPERLAKLVFQAVEYAQIEGASGHTYNLNRQTILMPDSGRRDIASRVIQNAALEIEFSRMNEVFEDSQDGQGRVYPMVADGFDHRQQVEKFPGLADSQTADIGFELTGETHSRVAIHDLDDLKTAFNLNKNRPLIVEVNAHQPPFTATPMSDVGRHVVTITDIKSTPDGKSLVYFQNQWGADSDHSTDATAVDGQLFAKNMESRLSTPFALVKGYMQNAVYNVDEANGRLVPQDNNVRVAASN